MTASTLNLPPYGFINAENDAFLRSRPVPRGFRLDPGDTDGPVGGADQWEDWLGALADEMAGFLWPVWLEGGWEGEAAGQALRLTEADLQVMRDLQGTLSERIRGAGGMTGRHLDAFKREDTGVPGATFEYYEPKLPAMLREEMTNAVMTGGLQLARPASQGLKNRFLRPRPQQVAMLLGQRPLPLQPSASAITPAMISGHCIQGTLALAQVMASMSDVLEQTPGLLQDVQRFLVDTGDRRVFAGLHYPSDNLGSWYTALRLCDHVFGADGPEIRTRLWGAIQDHSMVWKAMDAAVRADAQSVYAPLLARLDAAAGGAGAAA